MSPLAFYNEPLLERNSLAVMTVIVRAGRERGGEQHSMTMFKERTLCHKHNIFHLLLLGGYLLYHVARSEISHTLLIF